MSHRRIPVFVLCVYRRPLLGVSGLGHDDPGRDPGHLLGRMGNQCARGHRSQAHQGDAPGWVRRLPGKAEGPSPEETKETGMIVILKLRAAKNLQSFILNLQRGFRDGLERMISQ